MSKDSHDDAMCVRECVLSDVSDARFILRVELVSGLLDIQTRVSELFPRLRGHVRVFGLEGVWQLCSGRI